MPLLKWADTILWKEGLDLTVANEADGQRITFILHSGLARHLPAMQYFNQTQLSKSWLMSLKGVEGVEAEG